MSLKKLETVQFECTKSDKRACGLYRKAMQLMHPADSSWTPPVLTRSAATNAGIDILWSQVLKHRARFEATAWFDKRRRAQMVQWMWDLVNEHIQRVLHERPEVREVSARAEAQVWAGMMTAADGAENIIRAVGLE